MPIPVPNIWQLQTRGDVDALSEALRHPDSGTRRGAAAALRALGAWQAVPALQAALAVENDWQVHAALTAAIDYLDYDIHIETLIRNKDVRGLSKMLNSNRAEDIITACRALGSIGEKLAVEPLVMVFRNPMLPARVRLESAEALLKLKNPPAVVTLLGALRRDDWQVRRNAAGVLGQLGANWALDPLIKALEDVHPSVRRTAAAALRRIGTSEALEAVERYERTLLPEDVDAETSDEATLGEARSTEPKPPTAAQAATESQRKKLSDIITNLRANFASEKDAGTGNLGDGGKSAEKSSEDGAAIKKRDTQPLPRPGTSPLNRETKPRPPGQLGQPAVISGGMPSVVNDTPPTKKKTTDKLPDLPSEPAKPRYDPANLPKTGRLPSLPPVPSQADSPRVVRSGTGTLTPPGGGTGKLNDDLPPGEKPKPD
ncbi:MAG TPA: HEAT repeat domain-containing protein [Aggregatilineales bacterium]|nr:HEAT repeat domain-containing protein [Anaerolineales bacterium]HRE48171.1 HEAT repeat domain-containing protein [Aggregatilineales bacterium]